MSKEVMKKEETLPAETMDISALMATDAQENSGFETMTSDDWAIPYLSILQSGSPQVKKGDGKVEGAEEGDFYNTVSQEVFKNSIRLVPCYYEKAWVEWTPRESGGGFVKSHSDESILTKCVKDDKNRDMLPNGNRIVTTVYHYCLLVRSSGDFERVVVTMTSTQLKKSRKWNTQMLNRTIEINGKKIVPPTFSHAYLAETVAESNDQGSWSGWKIGSPELITDAGTYVAARKFHEDVKKGGVKVAQPQEDAVPESSTESEHF